jgi:hypothetical protein
MLMAQRYRAPGRLDTEFGKLPTIDDSWDKNNLYCGGICKVMVLAGGSFRCPITDDTALQMVTKSTRGHFQPYEDVNICGEAGPIIMLLCKLRVSSTIILH